MLKGKIFILLLSVLFFACNDGRLSPIDINQSVKNDSLTPLFNDYNFVENFKVENKGNYINIIVPECVLIAPDNESYTGKEFELKEVHIVTPSEHKVNGKSFPFEMQYIHQDSTGETAIVSVFIEEGDYNMDIQDILNSVPVKNKETQADIPLDLYTLLPQSPDYWTYVGSTTYKPIIQNVKWYIFKETLKLSADQISILKGKIDEQKNEVVEIGDRKIYEL